VVNPAKDSWYCFRHMVGGGSREALAVDCGILDCAEVKKGCLRGLTWIRLTKEAMRRGLV
ncbi:MAG: hypothetical protein NTW48_10285, partial [Chloroflexi bacterium]|nr:hypothetical protein [Chloroflexota bacterium]